MVIQFLGILCSLVVVQSQHDEAKMTSDDMTENVSKTNALANIPSDYENEPGSVQVRFFTTLLPFVVIIVG